MGEAENNALQSGRRRTMIVAHGEEEEEEEDVAAVVAIKGEGEEELSRSLDRPTPPTPQQPLSVGLLSVQGNPGWFRVGGGVGGWKGVCVCKHAKLDGRGREGGRRRSRVTYKEGEGGKRIVGVRPQLVEWKRKGASVETHRVFKGSILVFSKGCERRFSFAWP